MYRQSEKNLLSSKVSPTCPQNMVNLRPSSGWDLLVSLGHPCKFQPVSRLCIVTARHSSSGSGCQPNFAALHRGRQLYSAGRPSPWALAHISSGCSSVCICIPGRVWQSIYSKQFSRGQHQYGAVLNWCWLRVLDRCTWTLPCEYDWTVCVQRRCGLMSNYFDHLLTLIIMCCPM